MVDPDLQIRGRGGWVVSKTLRKGGGASLQKKNFSDLQASVWSKTKGGGEGGAGPSPGSTTAYATCTSPIVLFICPPAPPQKICIIFFSFLLGITAIPSEIEKNAYAIFFFWGGGRGANKVHYGRCVSAIFSNL